MPEDYILLPEKEIKQIRRDIAELKKIPLGDMGKEILGSMESLKQRINTMLELFEEAGKLMKAGEEPGIKELNEKLDTISDQNAKIAQGIITVADMLKEEKPKPVPREIPPLRPEMEHPVAPPAGPPPPVFRPAPTLRPAPPQVVTPPLGFRPAPPGFRPAPPGFRPEEKKKKGLFRR